MEQRHNLTPREHWELHQSLWNMLGCDMQVYKQDSDRIIYIDKNSKWAYKYEKGFIDRKLQTNPDRRYR